MKSSNNNDQSYWDEHLLPLFKSKYSKIDDKLIGEELIEKFRSKQNELINSKEKYKKEFNQVKYFFSIFCLFFSIILLFIPFYWSYKWFKKLKAQKNQHLEEIKNKIENKLIIHQELVREFDFDKFFKNFDDIIKYQHMGPIPSSLVNEFQSLSLFNLNDYSQSNSFLTSWGILEKNKIIVHKSHQILDEYLKTYTGSIIVYTYSIDSRGNRVSTPHTITATYEHQAFDIKQMRHSYTFMTSCSNLEFSFDKESSMFSSKKFNKKNNYAPLENSEFDKKYNWVRNDDTQFRMLFTPYAQEMFLKEAKGNKLPKSLQWKKESSFISNEFDNSHNSFIWKNNLHLILDSFLNDENMDINDFIDCLYQIVITYYHNLFNSFNYMWLTTLLTSEDQSSIINKVLNQNSKINNDNYTLFFHNVLSEVLQEEIINLDTKCFNDLENIEWFEEIKNHKLYKVKMKGTSFKIENRVKYIPTMSPKGIVNVPVKYKHYIPYYDYAYLYGTFLPNNSNMFFVGNQYQNKFKTNIQNQKILGILEEISTKAKVIISNNILAIYTKNNEINFDDKVKELLNVI